MRLPTAHDGLLRQAFAIIEREDVQNQKINRDIEIGDRKLYISDENGTRYYLTVNAGEGLSLTMISPSETRAHDIAHGIDHG